MSPRKRPGITSLGRAAAFFLLVAALFILTLQTAFAVPTWNASDDGLVLALTMDPPTVNSSHVTDKSPFSNICVNDDVVNISSAKVIESGDFEAGDTAWLNCSYSNAGMDVKAISMWVWPETIIKNTNTYQVGKVTLNQPWGGLHFGKWTSACDGAEEAISFSNTLGSAMNCWNVSLYAGTWHHILLNWNDTETRYNLYINGSYKTWIAADAGKELAAVQVLPSYGTIGRRLTVAEDYYDGKSDELYIFNRSLSSAERYHLFNNASGVNGALLGTASPPPSTFPYVKILVRDNYDNSVIQYANVTLSDGTSNLTNAAGIAVFNHSGNVAYNITDNVQGRYFDFISTTNATENYTTTINITGAFPTFNASNIMGVYLQNFSACVAGTCNYTESSTTKLLLSPNSSFNITIVGYDGNHSAAFNDTNQTYFNQTYELTTTGRDTSLYNISGLYQNNLTLNVSIGNTASYLSNFTINITGPVNYTGVFTSNYTTNHRLMAGDYVVKVDPVGYSLNNRSLTLAIRNYSTWFTVPVFALNSFYVNIRDELSRELITDTMSIEIISDLSAGNYSTTNGTYIFELLTPTDYTLRWKGDNWPERDYYQTLINQNYYNLNLYSLTLGNASTLLVTVVDTTGEPLSGATVQLRRFFVYCNCYEVVEMAKTSFSGEAYLNVDAYDGHYKLAVTYGGRTLLTDSPENYVPTTTGVAITRTITFNTGSDYYESYAALPEISRSLVYNDATGAFSFSWADPSGLVDYGCFVVEYANMTRYEEISTCQNGSNGNVIYSLPDKDNTTYRYYAYIETSTNYSEYSLFAGYKDKDPAINFGAAGYFLGGLMVMLFGLIGAAIGAIAGLVFTALSLVLVIALGLLPLGWGLATGVITMIAGLGIFLMRR